MPDCLAGHCHCHAEKRIKGQDVFLFSFFLLLLLLSLLSLHLQLHLLQFHLHIPVYSSDTASQTKTRPEKDQRRPQNMIITPTFSEMEDTARAVILCLKKCPDLIHTKVAIIGGAAVCRYVSERQPSDDPEVGDHLSSQYSRGICNMLWLATNRRAGRRLHDHHPQP